MDRRMLVTGAAGFVGTYLCKYLSKPIYKEDTVVAFIRNFPPNCWQYNALANCHIVKGGDIRDFHFLKEILNKYEIEWVFHLAALPIVKTAYRDPISYFNVNIMGTVNVLEACRQLDVEKALIMSTDKIYGNKENATEEDKLVPTEPYSMSKIATDLIAQTFMKTYDLNVVIPRYCNIYGYDPFNNRIVPNTIKACLKGESPIIFKDDYSTRQYIYVEDVVESLKLLMEKDVKGTINIATNDILTQEEVVLRILKHFPSLKPRYVEKKQIKEITNQSMKMRDWGWKPKFSFDEGIKETIKMFRTYWW